MHFPKVPVPSPDIWKAGLRTAVAGGLAYGVAEFFALPRGFWSVVTAVVIMGQPRVGASLKAGVDRFLGTIVGAVAGIRRAGAVGYGNPGRGHALTLLAKLASLSVDRQIHL